jgi:peptide/nickel transport system ATP-binding protein
LGNAILQLEKRLQDKYYIEVRILPNLAMQNQKKERNSNYFQDPYSSLNPRIPVGKAIMEPMKVHGLYKMTKRKAKRLKFSKE